MLRVCADLGSTRSIENNLERLLNDARDMLSVDAAALFLVDRGRLRLACRQDEAVTLRGQPFGWSVDRLPMAVAVDDPPDELASWVWRTGRLLNVVDVAQLPAELANRIAPAAAGGSAASLLAAPLIDRGAVSGVLQLLNRRDASGQITPFTARDERIVQSLAAVAAVSVRNAQLDHQLHVSHLDTILRLASAAEFRDGDTGQHIRRMSCYCELISRGLGHDPEWCRAMLFASPMHDVGKLAIPDAILKKPGPLTDDERRTMQQHTVLGARLLAGSRNEILMMAERIALTHHEHWNGSGYPAGLAGEDIHLEGRIAAVADVFDALTNVRVYKRSFDLAEAFDLIESSAARQFDPQVVAAFVNMREEVVAIYEAYRPGET
ncbi:MAG: HD domain-containing phosphohydrolase [Phycisphaerae bacterium]